MQRLRVLVCIAAIGYGVLLVAGSLPGFPEHSPTHTRMPYLADKPIGEDGYYMLTVAWRFGTGHGLSYNQDQPTTGIQPLSTVLDAAIAALVAAAGGDRWSFARVMLAIGFVYWLALSWCVGCLARKLATASGATQADEIGVLASLLALLSYNVFRMSTYGLETPLYLMLFGACVWRTLGGLTSLRDALVLGVIAGFTVLARIDFLVVLSVFLAIQFLRGRRFWVPSVVAGVSAVIVAVPWFAVVYAKTGHLLPTSGRAQQGWPRDGAEWLDRLMQMGDAFSQHLSPWLYAPAMHAAVTDAIGTAAANPAVSVVVGVTGAAIAWAGWNTLSGNSRTSLAGWLAALGVLSAVYVSRFAWVFFFERYMATLLIITVPLIAIGLTRLVADRRILTAVPVLMCLSFAVSAWVTLHTGRIGNANSLNAGFISRHLPPPALVGAYQAGVVGYYNSNVVNLDGKMNAAVVDASTPELFNEFLHRSGITHLVDWPSVRKPGLAFSSWPDCGLGTIGYSSCYVKPLR